MSRRDSREVTVKIIFQNEFIDRRLRTDGAGTEMISPEDMLSMYISSSEEHEAEKADRGFVVRVLEQVVGHIDEIDALIAANLDPEWTVKRLCRIDLAILREAIAEIEYFDDIPVSVTINEAVELAKKFSYPEAPAFINGILGSVSRR